MVLMSSVPCLTAHQHCPLLKWNNAPIHTGKVHVCGEDCRPFRHGTLCDTTREPASYSSVADSVHLEPERSVQGYTPWPYVSLVSRGNAARLP